MRRIIMFLMLVALSGSISASSAATQQGKATMSSPTFLIYYHIDLSKPESPQLYYRFILPTGPGPHHLYRSGALILVADDYPIKADKLVVHKARKPDTDSEPFETDTLHMDPDKSIDVFVAKKKQLAPSEIEFEWFYKDKPIPAHDGYWRIEGGGPTVFVDGGGGILEHARILRSRAARGTHK
jgi:hypothetical protein